MGSGLDFSLNGERLKSTNRFWYKERRYDRIRTQKTPLEDCKTKLANIVNENYAEHSNEINTWKGTISQLSQVVSMNMHYLVGAIILIEKFSMSKMGSGRKLLKQYPSIIDYVMENPEDNPFDEKNNRFVKVCLDNITRSFAEKKNKDITAKKEVLMTYCDYVLEHISKDEYI